MNCGKMFEKLYAMTYHLSNFTMHFWDFLHGTDFSVIEKSVGGEGRYPYYATPWASLWFLREHIRRTLSGGQSHAILDIGCGKGFMLYFFSGLCFDMVSGIEYDRHLYRKARQNLEKICPKDCRQPTVYLGDAADFSWYADYDVFYLYNPFNRDIFEKVVERIMESRKERPRRLVLFYCNPLYRDVLLERGWKEIAHFYYKTRVYSLSASDENH